MQFVSKTNIPLNDLLVFCNQWRILVNLLNILLWISLCNYLALNVLMMLFLVSSIAFHVFVCSFHVVLVLRLLSVLSCFLRDGFVDMVYLKRSYLTETQNLRLLFGKNFLGCWAVRLHFPVHIIHKRMDSLSDFIAQLSRYYVVTVLASRNGGTNYWLNVSSP